MERENGERVSEWREKEEKETKAGKCGGEGERKEDGEEGIGVREKGESGLTRKRIVRDERRSGGEMKGGRKIRIDILNDGKVKEKILLRPK